MPKPILLAALIATTMLFSGCAIIDRSMLKPAAEASRVPPLFRSANCVGYRFNNGARSMANPGTWRNPFVKNECEGQEESIVREGAVAVSNSNVRNSADGTTAGVSDVNVCDTRSNTQQDLLQCAAYLERVSDTICNVHLSKIFGNRAVTNMALGTLATASGIAGGLVSGGAANALSGSAGFLTADRSLFNEEVYRNYVAEAVIKEIQKNREKAKADIAAAIVGQSDVIPTKAITVTEQVVQRVSEMHDACSFYAGLTSLLGKAGKEDFADNLRDGVAAQITFLKGERARLEEQLKVASNDQKKDLMARITNLDAEIVRQSSVFNSMANGHVLESAVTTPAPTPTPVDAPAAAVTIP